VLYHMRYPFNCLRVIRDVMRPAGTLILETAVYTLHEDAPLLYCPVGSESPYEHTSVTFFNEPGLAGSLRSFGFIMGTPHYLNGHIQPIDRCTVACEFRPETIDRATADYWEGSHHLNSDGPTNIQYLGARPRQSKSGPED
jgi:hypothetical protein